MSVDIKEIRTRADRAPSNRDKMNCLLYSDIPDMCDEIERLRVRVDVLESAAKKAQAAMIATQYGKEYEYHYSDITSEMRRECADCDAEDGCEHDAGCLVGDALCALDAALEPR